MEEEINSTNSKSSLEDEISQDFYYRSSSWQLEAVVICESKEKFIDIAYTKCVLEDKTVIIVDNAKKGDYISFRCYFSKPRDIHEFPSIDINYICPFKMQWRAARNDNGSFSYNLIDLYPFHSHKRFTDNQIQYESKSQRIPVEMQEKAIKYFKLNFTIKNI